MAAGTLYDLAYKGDFNQVKVKLDEDNELLEVPDANGRLLIHWAALGGNENLVEFLIDCGSPFDSEDSTKTTPLILASSAGRFEVVRLLLGKGADVNHVNQLSQSSLLYACSKGHKEIMKLLINCEANVNHTDTFKATPLHRASSQGRVEIVKYLLEQPNILIDACDSTKSTPLHLACEEDRDEVASLLIKAGASTTIENIKKKTPIELCSTKLQKTLVGLASQMQH